VTDKPAAAGEQENDAAGGNTEVDNKVGGDQTGTQAGVVHGDIKTTINYLKDNQSELLARSVNNEELKDIREQFVPPADVDRAAKILRDSHVLVLVGVDCGRTFTGRRLLDDRGCARIVHLNRDRRVGSVQARELKSNDGYLWDLTEQGKRPFTGREFDDLAQIVRATPGCHLVLLLNDVDQMPAGSYPNCVALRAPDAIAVARKTIRRRLAEQDTLAVKVLETDLAELLSNAPPYKAVHVADLAIRVADGTLTVEKAKQEISAGVDHAIAEIMVGEWKTIEFTMMLAIAVLEDEPFDEVVRRAKELDDLIRRSELPEDKKLRPRRAFIKPKDELLAAIHARTYERDHPIYPGLKMLTARFERHDWAAAALCRIWQQYHVDRDLLLEWMCGIGFTDASVRALCTLITRVPAHNPLHELERLVMKGRWTGWHLAGRTLTVLEDDHGLRPLVERTLTDWVDSDSLRKMCAAAITYGLRFDQADPEDTFAQLGKIGRHQGRSIHIAVGAAMLHLLSKTDHLQLLLRTVVAWADDRRSVRDNDGLRAVGVDVGTYLLRLRPDDDLKDVDTNPAMLVADYPDECRRLIKRIIADPIFGPEALTVLHELTYWYPLLATDEQARVRAADLLRNARLLVPDLRWWRRSRAVAELCRALPAHRHEIRRIIRYARRVERSGLCQDVTPATPAPDSTVKP
jgi:hypothetical protein